jgi:hypothetical protein
VFFWMGTPRPAAAEESLSALLAKRGQVRAERTGAGAEARPELFKPQQPAAPMVLPTGVPHDLPVSHQPAAEPEAKPATPEAPANTTSRLLEAKRRAQKRRE